MTRDPSSTSPNAPDPRGVFSRARIASACLRFARTHAVLLVSALAAAATMLVVPPDASYLGYFDLKTLACLFGILALVGALRNAGVFEATARAMVARFSTCRAAVAAIVGITLVLSMVATNDMALIMMLPLCAATLLKAGWERALPFAFIMQSLAANLGGMIVPFGNPQNLYLFERFDIPLTDFLATMAVSYTHLAVASLFRNIPVVAWAFILLFSFKQSEFTGFFALFLTSFGYLTRCFLESIDEMSAGPVEALRASGATYGQIVAQAVVPMSITSVISWVMYMIETNIRDATLIGLLTGTGIGFVFDVYYKSFRYDIAGLVILSIVLVVIACELTSNFVRRKVI